jgi:hypothetical protein
VKSLPGAEKDLFQTIQSLPGVTSTGDYFGWLYVRGGLPEENLFLLDGMEIPNPYHFSGLASVFSTDLVDTVRFSTGGFGAERGDRIASVLEVETRPARSRLSARAGADVTEVAGTFEHAAGPNLSLVAAGRHSYLDRVLSQLNLGESYVLPTYTDLQARAQLRLGENASLSASGLYSSEQATAGDSGHWRRPALSLGSRLGTGSVVLDWQPGAQARLRAALSYAGSRTRFEVTDLLTERSREHEPRKMTLAADCGLGISERVLLDLGAGVSAVDYRHRSTMPEEVLNTQVWGDSLAADTAFAQAEAHATVRAGLGDRMNVALGARLDLRTLGQEVAASPRVSLCYEAWSGARVRAAAGLYRQFVAPELLNPNGSQPEPMSALHFVAGLEQELGSGFSARVEAYDKELANLVVVESGRLGSNGRGWARGVELCLRRSMGSGLFCWASYAYARAERSWLHDIALSPADGEQPHVVNLAGSAMLPGAVELGLKLRVASGAPYTPDIFVRENHCFVGPHNSGRFPLYQRLDLRAARSFRVGQGRLDAYLSVLNVTGARNVQKYYFDNEGQRHAIYMLPRLPVLGLEYRF